MESSLAPSSARLILATHNAHKVQEVRNILAKRLPQFQEQWIISAAELNVPEPVEDGLTFAENSLIKARTLVAATGLPAVADDSGITVKALGGAPGIFSARWAGKHGDDRANRQLLLNQLADLPPAHRQAAFVCAACLVTPSGEETVEIGELTGHLATVEGGENGFGYDPIFVPTGYEITTAQMLPDEKNRISHRAKALNALAPAIEKILNS
ncbi:RdgB/HAM1 family non-canonical purine NTP pyrophosphatase [Actinomycetaceae bacterium TAE3-ERU4]|nr:RdgB/HAM1 family non-canonical purine NTP pyrophosphatase [Actinomycetaceae bacterium TAE3-ERU4]